MRPFRFAVIALTLFVPLTGALARAATLRWPATDIARHAQAWFAMLASDDAAARAFYAEHIAPASLAEVSLDERMQRRHAMQERTQGLTPLEVVDATPTSLGVRCKAGNGDLVVARFESEPDAPHRLLGVRIEAGADAGRPEPPPAGPPLDDAQASGELRKLFDQHAAAGDFSGVALLARPNATLLSGAWGLADRAQQTPNATDTRFNFGSIGKLFTKTAVAQLVQVGKLSLDDKLSRWLPDFPHADSITVDMLVQHRSGVGDFFNDAYRAMDRSKLRHNRDYLALIRNQPLWFTPGTDERYSNGGYALLGEVIAKASGEDYYDYLAKHVFAPAGMRDTGYPVEGDGAPRVAHGYTSRDGGGPGERDNAGTRPARGSAAGGGYTTTADLLAFDRALLGAKLCDAKRAAWVVGGDDLKSPHLGFAGGAPGIAAEWLREGDVTLIVLTNRDPETTREVMQPARAIVRRMRPANRVRS